MIYIRTCAYNAEKTLKRTVDSILSQTISEFTYYLLDNGSTDGTTQLVQQYAEQDARIVPFYNKINRNYEENPDFWLISHQLKDDDYLVVLDADDWYDATFLEEMINFVKENHLDMAACGTEFFEEGSERPRGTIVQHKSIVLDSPESYDAFFPSIHWNLRQTWGKIYSAKVARARYEMNSPEWFPKSYGGDTMNVLVSLADVDRIGVYGKVLHHYQVSNNSVSYKWMEGREKADWILHKKTEEYLMKKAGQLSPVNQTFLYTVYLNAIWDTMQVLIKSGVSQEKMWEVLGELFDNEDIKCALETDLYAFGGNAVQKKVIVYREALAQWALDNIKVVGETNRQIAQRYLLTYNEDLFRLGDFNSFQVLSRVDKKLAKALLLQQYEVVLERTQIAMDILEDKAAEKGILILWAQNVAALLSRESEYVKFSKCWIKYLIAIGEKKSAQKEIMEWMQILPDDGDIQTMLEEIEE